MSEGGRDPVALAVARLELAVERLAFGLTQNPAGLRGAAGGGGEPVDAPALRAEVAALAARLDASIARLREVVRDEAEPGGNADPRDQGEEE
ncbi:MAG: hypothetical protein AVDCRST_MAG08-2864 [uncultured Acetobacteraceae bacterium]|jgi:hypothetical protein|uniref:Uncharacterized protein n=1 Tax=uncultured Acetobacteraceae bacterium TaxID=169975 RepID=A0A6J4IXG0_9PROT|nr:MAG: hypothetical protein AVDCRST_MAG08-2864 [uncultured Acetobacteraceae bacterium]